MKKLNPVYLSGPDACRQPNPATECEFRNGGRVLEAELLPGQDYCDICRCKLLAYEEEPVATPPPPPPIAPSPVIPVEPSWLARNGRWLALGVVVLLGALLFLWPRPAPPVTQQCDGYDLYEYVDGIKGKLIAKNSKSCGFPPKVEPVPEPVKPVKQSVKIARRRVPKSQPSFKCEDGERVEFTYDASGNITRRLETHQPCN